MRKKIVAGNWKMNNNLEKGKQLIADLLQKDINTNENKLVVLAPSFVQLHSAAQQIEGKQNFYLAAQNCHNATSGAYTGEVSASMIKSVGCTYVILGHSERREYFNETDSLLNQKVNTALAEGLKVIFCCGEPLSVREAGTQNDYVANQIINGVFSLSESAFKNIVIAYEPIWAIGTGKTASAAQAQDMHAHIRQTIANKYSDAIAQATTILYGGSCKPDNANELFSQPDVDGGLIGGASLVADDFATIINAL